MLKTAVVTTIIMERPSSSNLTSYGVARSMCNVFFLIMQIFKSVSRLQQMHIYTETQTNSPALQRNRRTR